MKDLIISDLHIDPLRQGGTTMESRVALADYIQENLRRVVQEEDPDRVIVVGDIFARRTVSEKALAEFWKTLQLGPEWILMRGNHDANSDKYGDICALQAIDIMTDDRVRVIFDGPESIGTYHFIPHMFNQEQFDRALEEIPAMAKTVFIHANWNNNFAVMADHSLNLSLEQAKKIEANGQTIILGHEHIPADKLENTFIVGCLTPTMLPDIDGPKRALVFVDEKPAGQIPTWPPQLTSFQKIQPHEIDDLVGNPQFIEVYGECSPVESAEITKAIGKLRAKSSAFIVKNGIKIIRPEVTGPDQQEIAAFNVVDIFMDLVPEQYKEKVASCR